MLVFPFPAEPPLLAHGAPIITSGIGQALSIPCMLLDGIPLPERHWSKNGKPVRLLSLEHVAWNVSVYPHYSSLVLSEQIQLNGRVFLRSDGSLYFEKAIAEDAGTYVCTAVNVAGSANITVSLEIHGEQAH